MSFNVKTYLVDIDKELTAHRQEIAKRRLRISELEDMRVLMMQREEYRAEMAGEASPFGTLPHGVEIAVRRQMDEGALSLAAKTGQPPVLALTKREQKSADQRRKRAEKKAAQGGLNSKGNKRGMNQPPTRNPAGHGSHNRYKSAVIAMLKPGIELSVGAIIDRLGEGPKVGNERQPVYQALYELRKHGIIHSPNGPGSYVYKGLALDPVNSTPAGH